MTEKKTWWAGGLSGETPMTEEKWLACFDPNPMLEYLHGKASDRKFRLFSCACYRRTWDKLPKESRQAVEVAERFVDGEATREELRSVRQLVASHPYLGTAMAFRNATGYSAVEAGHGAAHFFSLTPDGQQAWRPFVAERKYQTAIVSEIFGSPFRPVTINPAWVTPTVSALATATYEERSLPSGQLDNTRLTVLADALEEAGCDNADMLTHLRAPGSHVRGCWVVDLLLGKA
jgi:hypothetical protein